MAKIEKINDKTHLINGHAYKVIRGMCDGGCCFNYPMSGDICAIGDHMSCPLKYPYVYEEYKDKESRSKYEKDTHN